MAAIQYPPLDAGATPRTNFISTPWTDPSGKQWLFEVLGDTGRWNPVPEGASDFGDLDGEPADNDALAAALALKAPLASPTFTGPVTAANADSGVGANISSDSGVGANISSNTNTAANIRSTSGTGASIRSTSGTYHATFGNTGIEQSFVARLKGAFGWIRGAFTGRIYPPDTLTGDRTWELPDASGTLALTSDIALKAPLASPTFTGTVTAVTHKAASTAGIEVLNSANVSLLRIGKYNATTGYSTGITEGGTTTASGNYSHAEGISTTASGNYSHAEGSGTTASGSYSHAEGGTTTASGIGSHAEGSATTASGNYSHAAGTRAKATLLGSRVMTDSQNADCTSLATDSCTFRYQNGYRFLGGAADFAVAPTVTGSGTLALTSDINTLAKLDTIVADATLARTDAGQTFAGAQAFSGQISSSGSTDATNTNNVVNVATNDARYGKQQYLLRLTSSFSAVSSTVVSSGQTLTLPAGTYLFESVVIANCEGTSGLSAHFQSSGNYASPTSLIVFSTGVTGDGVPGTASQTSRNHAINGPVPLQYATGTYLGSGSALRVGQATGSGVISFSTSQTITPQIKQTLTDAANAATMQMGSYVKFTEL